MTIRRTVTKRVEDDHCTLTCIISVMVLGMMAGVVELTADPVGSVATNVPMANGVRQSTLTVCGPGCSAFGVDLDQCAAVRRAAFSRS
jgi:hypothetical protein